MPTLLRGPYWLSLLCVFFIQGSLLASQASKQTGHSGFSSSLTSNSALEPSLGYLGWVGTAPAASVLTVNSTQDADDGECSASAGGCTLREAINAANAGVSNSTIIFDPSVFANGGQHVIAVNSPLPALTTSGIQIYGAGYYAGNYVGQITINGTAAGTDANGLVLASDNNVMSGLAFANFAKDGILITGADNRFSSNCNGYPIFVFSNGGYGVHVTGEAADGNKLMSFLTSNFGQAPYGNALGGVLIDGGADNTTSLELNCTGSAQIDGNSGPGITISGPETTGTNLNANIGGGPPNQGQGPGILIKNGASNNRISGSIFNSMGDGFRVEGGTSNRFVGSISNVGGIGINLVAASDGSSGITPNDPGDADEGPNHLLNTPVILRIEGTSGNYSVSGTACSGCTVSLYNATGGPSNYGPGGYPMGSTTADAAGNWNFYTSNANQVLTATAMDSDSNMSEFSQNFVSVPFSLPFFEVNSNSDADDGACTASAGGCTFREAINSANTATEPTAIRFSSTAFNSSSPHTIRVTRPLPALTRGGTKVYGSGSYEWGQVGYITVNGILAGAGVDGLLISSDNNQVTGLLFDGFSGNGIRITGANNILAAGCNPSYAVQASGSGAYGLRVSGEAADGNIIRGVNLSGNTAGGIIIEGGADNTTDQLPGCSSTAGVSSHGNTGPGITVSDPGTTGTVLGNSGGIGSNRSHGILITNGANGNQFGASIFGNEGNGVRIEGGAGNGASGNRFSGPINNNRDDGVRVEGGSGNGAVGNEFLGEISYNMGSGVRIVSGGGGGASNNRFTGPIRNNTGDGISIEGSTAAGASNNQFEGIISGNGRDGLRIAAGTGNRSTASITSSSGLGINLVAPGDGTTGVTPNDPGDSDNGPNTLLNFPVITSIAGAAGNYSASGTACANCTVQLYTATGDPTGHGEGERYVSTIADASGNWSVSLSNYFRNPLTAVAFDAASNMSEFSPNFSEITPTPVYSGVFTNSSQINLQVYASTAFPYPSSVFVSELSGTIPVDNPAAVKVTLNSISHTYFSDLGFILEDPSGRRLLMQLCATDVTTGFSASQLTYSISDSGATQLSNTTNPVQGGVYRPASYCPASGGPTAFAHPVGTNYSNPGPAAAGTSTFQSVFGGTRPNGEWRLYVQDFFNGDGGSIAGGWTLSLIAGGPEPSPTPTPTRTPTPTPTPIAATPTPTPTPPAPVPCTGPCAYGYDSLSESLVMFQLNAPGTIINTIPLTGLDRSNPNAPEFISGMDFRPNGGQLYGIATKGFPGTDRLVTINTITGAMAPVAPGTTFPTGVDQSSGMDLNPVADAVRQIGDNGTNRRISPTTGALLGTDTTFAYVAGDPGYGSTPNIVHVAYTNNVVGAATTTLYGIDANRNTLVRIGGVDGNPSPNTGQVTTVGLLGLNPSIFGGFDIAGSTGLAYASLFINSEPHLVSINLATGAATVIGTIGDGTMLIDGFALTTGSAPIPTPTPSPTITPTPVISPTPTPTPTPVPTPEATPFTPEGTNVTTTNPVGNGSVTFSSVTSAGTTSFTPIDPSSAGVPPSGYTVLGGNTSYDISTTAVVTPPIVVCFNVTGVSDPGVFANVRILHGEGGQLVDRTILAPDAPAPDFASKRVCARVSSLSPFIAALAPAGSPVSISGVITYGSTPVGQPAKYVPGVALTAAGSIPANAATNASGAYSLGGLGSGAYTVTPSKSGNVNGISTLDATRVAQHVVGLTVLTPNQIVAGDATNNGTLSALDATRIAQAAVGIPNNGIAGQWKFLPASRNYSSVASSLTEENYTAILVGDVTGNWMPPSAARPSESVTDTPEPAFSDAKAVSEPGKLIDWGSTDADEIALSTDPAYRRDAGISIPISIADTTDRGIFAYDLLFEFDPKVISPASTLADTAGTLSAGWSVICNAQTPGRIRVLAFGTTPLTGNGELVNLRFNLIGAATAQDAELKWISLKLNEGEIPSKAADKESTSRLPEVFSKSFSGFADFVGVNGERRKELRSREDQSGRR